MPRITYIEHDGTRHDLVLPAGTTVMRGAVDHGIPGIDGDCGGVCACATCHVHVDPQWLARLPPAAGREQDMLGFTAEAAADSRLGCQVTLSDALDGLVVHLPAAQH